MRHILTITLILLLFTNLFAQSTEKIVLEPVGRYIFQKSDRNFEGTDHILGTIGLSDGKIMSLSSSGIAIIDLSTMSIPGSIDYISRSGREGGGGRDVAIYKDTFLYINNHQSESRITTTGIGISKITADGITSITNLTETDVFFEKVKVFGDFLYAAAHDKGIRIYSLENPENPTLAGSLSEGFTDVFDMALSGDTLYVADGGGGLKVVDISDVSAPKIVAGETTTTAMGTAQDIEARDGSVYMACGGAGICVYKNGDLSTREVYPIIGCVEDVCWVGEYLATSTFGGVSVYEVGEGTEITLVASEKTSRFTEKAYIRTAFGVGAANDSILLVAGWDAVDCYQIKPLAESKVPDITCSTQRIRFPAAGGSEEHYLVNQGGATLIIDNVSTLTSDFSTTLTPQLLEPGDTLFFDISYVEGTENEGQVLFINSNDPDENPLPIQLFGKTSSLDAGEEVPDFTLPAFYTDPETGVYTEKKFTLSEQGGKVVWVQMFGTWCPACPSAEADMQNTIVKEFADNPNVETYVMNENQFDRDPLDWVKTWTSRFYQRGPMLYDADGTVGGGIFSQPNVGGMPFGRGFIIDQEGKVAKAFFGHQPQMAIETIYSLLENDTSTTAINYKQNTDESITIYPNPVNDNCTISLGKEYEQVKVELYNMEGQKLLSHNLDYAQSFKLNIGEMIKGIYLVHIYFDNTTSIKKLIKF
ncbi:MAG: T9SS type A sorting domain-containing protein [Bacteroidales bacterium]|nr:T9SS type A sorting domain-containing protein [Bacteroidales bacterium]MCF8405370.1 T9SS type A sorting domain-containing protein [Bacteroidales bacterium]